MKISYFASLLATVIGLQAKADSNSQFIESSTIPFGRPMMINTANFGDINQVLNQNHILELTSLKRLQLIPGTVLRRLEVRAAGTGRLVVMINDDIASNVVDLPNQINEFKTFTFEINKALPTNQNPLSVRILIGPANAAVPSASAKVRIADITAIAVDNQSATGLKGQGSYSSERMNNSSGQCSLEQAVSSYGWIIKKSGQGDSYFNSPVKLFDYVQGNCQGFRFRCEVGALGNRKDGSSALFGIFVEVRGDWLLATGAFAKNDADEKVKQMRTSGFCNY